MMNKNLDIGEAIRFLMVGVINTIVGSGVMFLLYNVGNVDYWISSISNYIVGSICSFFLNKYFTFKSKKFSASETVRFIINIVICYCIAYGLARPAARLIFSNISEKLQDNIALFAGMISFTLLNYLGQKLFVFKNREVM